MPRRLVEPGPPGSKLVYDLRTDDPVMGTREAPVALGRLNWPSQNGSVERGIEAGGAEAARWTGILAVLVSKPHKGGLFRGDVMVHPHVTLIAVDGCREVLYIVVGNRVRCPGGGLREQSVHHT